MNTPRSGSPAIAELVHPNEPTEAALEAGLEQKDEKLDENDNETVAKGKSPNDCKSKMDTVETEQTAGAVPTTKLDLLQDESSSDAASDSIVASGVITESMLIEERALHQKTIEDADEFQRKEEQSLKDLDDEIREQRYKRLQFLLSKSNMYTTYLIDRMKKQKQADEEKAAQKAKMQEKLEKQKAMSDIPAAEVGSSPKKAASAASVPGSPDLPPVRKRQGTRQVTTRRSLRGQKDAADSLSTDSSQNSQSSVASDASAKKSKRGRKRKERESSDSYRISDYFVEAARCKKQKLDNQAEERSDSGSKQMADQNADVEDLMTKDEDEPALRMVDGEPVDPLQPELLTGGVLRPYQIDGFKWLKVLFENGVNGILADEMGLGKTVQCISIIAHLVNHGVPGPFLVCAPLSTVPNWVTEFQRFAPKVPVILYHGSIQEREVLRKKIWKNHPVREGVAVKPVVITSYEIAMNDRAKINMFEWRYIIVDEGHRIKNHKCRLIRELKMYKSTHRLLLTGTPLQNNLAELWSLLNFLLPEIFDDLGTFEAWFDIDALESGSSGEQIVVQEQKNQVLSMLHQILTPFLLRRLKTDVDLCIPPKRELLVYAPLTKTQQDYYKHTVERTIDGWIQKRNEEKEEKVKLDKKGRPVRRSTNKKIDYSLMLEEEKSYKDKAEEEEDIEAWVTAVMEKGESDRNKGAGEKKKTALLSVKMQNIMMQLRKCCNHPYLIEYPLDPKTGELITDPQIHHKSGKLLLLDRMLPELKKKGHKVLLFSQMTKMLDILEDYMCIKKYKYCRLDGSMKWEDRKEQMELFNTDKDTFIFLLSTRAGGLGINLTAADTVIIYDSDWNPQSDLQAQDRCHRIGQTLPVMVYRLVTANTVDQKIVERAAAKRRLEKMVIHKGKFKSGIENFNTSLTAISPKELLELLRSHDHEGEVGAEREVISRRDLQALLDRSDLYTKWEQLKQASTKDKPSVGIDMTKEMECKNVEGVFKIIDEDSGKTGLETDLTAQTTPQGDIETVADVVCR